MQEQKLAWFYVENVAEGRMRRMKMRRRRRRRGDVIS